MNTHSLNLKKISHGLLRQIAITAGALILLGPSIHASETPLPRLESSQKMEGETKKMLQSIERFHYRNKPVAQLDFDQLIRDYMSNLDFNRSFFLQSDLDDFKRFNNSTFLSYLKTGNLYPAFEIFKVYRDRSLNRLDWALEQLENDFDFSTEKIYTPDRSEADWPANTEEADALWMDYLKYELLNELLNQKYKEASADEDKSNESADELSHQNIAEIRESDPERFTEILTEAKENLRRRYQRWKRNVVETDAENVQEIFLNTLTRMYDPHSGFLSADSREDFDIAIRNSLVGIGAVLSDEDGYCTIKELIPGGPASLSHKLNVNDKIVGVAQNEEGEIVDVIDMKLRKIVKKIRGKKGTMVRLIIQPADAVDPSEKREVRLIRDKINLTANLATAHLFKTPNGNDEIVPIGVIRLPSFYGGNKENTTQDVEELIAKLKEKGIKGLILDLRRNGGGLLSEAISLTGLFIPEGPVVQVRDTTGKITKRHDHDAKIAWDGPLVVLVSRHSASASEIVAGALQNHQRALITGDTMTHGKGTVQTILEFDNSLLRHLTKSKSGAAKITIQKFYLPDGNSTQEKGISADIALPSFNDFLPIGESDLPNALAWDSIEPFSLNDLEKSKNFTWAHPSLDTKLINGLRKQSIQRQNELEEFTYLDENIEWFNTKQEQETFSLNLALREAQREQDIQDKERMDKTLEELAENQFESEEILLDITLQQQEKENEHAEVEEGFLYKKEMDITLEELVPNKSKNEESLFDTTLQQQEKEKENTEVEQTETALTDTGEEEKESESKLDIHLRESLRIMSDWIQYEPGKYDTPIAQSESE